MNFFFRFIKFLSGLFSKGLFVIFFFIGKNIVVCIRVFIILENWKFVIWLIIVIVFLV